MSISESNNLHIYSAVFKPEGRRFELIGSFINSTWKIDPEIFPNERYILNGRHFRNGYAKVNLLSQRSNVTLHKKGSIKQTFLSEIVLMQDTDNTAHTPHPFYAYTWA